MRITMHFREYLLLFISLFSGLLAAVPASGAATPLFNEGIHLIPHPQEVSLEGDDFTLGKNCLLYWTGMRRMRTGLPQRNWQHSSRMNGE